MGKLYLILTCDTCFPFFFHAAFSLRMKDLLAVGTAMVLTWQLVSIVPEWIKLKANIKLTIFIRFFIESIDETSAVIL